MTWFGGKRRWAAEVWQFFGEPDIYSEPFAGSLAVLLHRSHPCKREVVCDTDGHLCNFWRALRRDPEAVAYHADYPTIHQDLYARRQWLAKWGAENGDRLMEDVDFCDPRAGAYWVWCVSQWIGTVEDMLAVRDQIPSMGRTIEGRGVQRQRVELQDKIPKMVGNRTAGGVGVQRQRDELRDQVPVVTNPVGGQGVQRQRPTVRDQIPRILDRERGGHGVQRQRADMRDNIPLARYSQGVQRQRTDIEAGGGDISDGSRLLPWFLALAARLANVIVLNRSWESAVTTSVLCDTATSNDRNTVAVFLDPPYIDRPQYGATEGDVNAVARAAYEWAVKHGDRYRIAYCAASGDFPVPEGWESRERTMKGVRHKHRERTVDRVIFSPACLRQRSLFDTLEGDHHGEENEAAFLDD